MRHKMTDSTTMSVEGFTVGDHVRRIGGSGMGGLDEPLHMCGEWEWACA